MCKYAGLAPRYERASETKQLFENLEAVWIRLGRQPRAKEMKQPLSLISISQFQRHFQKSWHEVCLQFLSWKSGLPVEEIESEARPKLQSISCKKGKHKTKRSVALSLRYDVMKRDSFKCIACGRSPATHPGLILHIDHIKPWDKGGETTPDNLQTLCSECNLGKSNKPTRKP